MTTTHAQRLFSINICGDPFSRKWDVHEYQESFDEDTCVFRGDISSMYTRDPLIAYLRRTYPGCKIRVER